MEWLYYTVPAVLIVIILFASGYLKAPPDTAFIISGLGRRRILIGRAGWRMPFFERVASSPRSCLTSVQLRSSSERTLSRSSARCAIIVSPDNPAVRLPSRRHPYGTATIVAQRSGRAIDPSSPIPDNAVDSAEPKAVVHHPIRRTCQLARPPMNDPLLGQNMVI